MRRYAIISITVLGLSNIIQLAFVITPGRGRSVYGWEIDVSVCVWATLVDIVITFEWKNLEASKS